MPLPDSTIWIVHRDAGVRTALSRTASAASGRHQLILGRPDDAIFDSAPTPSLVVLGLPALASGADFEDELEFARWLSDRRTRSAWILLAEAADHASARALFDTLDAELLVHPCDPPKFLRALGAAIASRAVEPLSLRAARDHSAARFARWFGRDEPPELGRALAARHRNQPLIAIGEPGTGRGLFLRYAHAFSADRPGPLLRIGCAGATRISQLVDQLEDSVASALRVPALARASNRVQRGRFGIWLDALDELPHSLQGHVLGWIELGLPADLAVSHPRWLASASSNERDGEGERPGLERELARAFDALRFETTPLRRQPERIASFVEDTARAFSSVRREVEHRFEPDALAALSAEPWPGNLAELESVVTRTLAHLDRDAERVHASDLRFETRASTSRRPRAEPSPQRDLPSARPETSIVDFALPESDPISTQPLESPRVGDPSPVGALQRLARAVAHEIRNPLVPIRTLAELLPEHHADSEFRARFSSLVGDGVRRIESVVDQLQRVAEPVSAVAETIDVTAMLEALLDERRDSILSRRLLVLKELDRAAPLALGDPALLRDALAGLVDAALAEIPDQGDLYLASRHHEATTRGGGGEHAPGATLRILCRYPTRAAAPPAQRSGSEAFRATVLAHVVAEAIVRSQGGSLAVDTTDAAETVIVIDLPAPH